MARSEPTITVYFESNPVTVSTNVRATYRDTKSEFRKLRDRFSEPYPDFPQRSSLQLGRQESNREL